LHVLRDVLARQNSILMYVETLFSLAS
jgi:hypothetical protein